MLSHVSEDSQEATTSGTKLAEQAEADERSVCARSLTANACQDGRCLSRSLGRRVPWVEATSRNEFSGRTGRGCIASTSASPSTSIILHGHIVAHRINDVQNLHLHGETRIVWSHMARLSVSGTRSSSNCGWWDACTLCIEIYGSCSAMHPTSARTLYLVLGSWGLS